MLLKKYVKNRRKIKILLLLMIVVLIVITLVILNSSQGSANFHLGFSERERLLDESLIANDKLEQQQQKPLLLQSPKENGIIVPEKYDEHKIKTRIIEEKINRLKQQSNNAETDEEPTSSLDTYTTAIHIFYSAPVPWYKSKKPAAASVLTAKLIRNDNNNSNINNNNNNNNGTVAVPITHKSVRILNTAFYPALGLYKPTTSLLQKHFQNIRNCGVGVLILSYTGKSEEPELYKHILELAPSYNLSVTFEISVAGNQSVEYLRQQLLAISQFSLTDGFYRVYSQTRNKLVPLLYISNAYKLSEIVLGRLLCRTHPDSLRRAFDAYFIGHIRLKNHAEALRRLCFEGFYSKLPSNGATFASTWKNWSYLKSFAITYKMLFVPTVGPGFAERNKFPRHGDIQRHRSNGRYYGVAWRTAIINHVGFINIASYNNWPDGSQIEEVMPRAGFLDYNPGAKTKYLDLTTHWVGNFLKNRQESLISGGQNCYEFLNNTIC